MQQSKAKRAALRDDLIWLADILESLTKLQKWFESPSSADEFAARDVLYSAVLREFTVIGEAVKRLSVGLTSQETQVNWRELAGFRDVLVHNYFGVRDSVVWDAVVTVAPQLREEISEIVQRLDTP